MKFVTPLELPCVPHGSNSHLTLLGDFSGLAAQFGTLGVLFLIIIFNSRGLSLSFILAPINLPCSGRDGIEVLGWLTGISAGMPATFGLRGEE